MPQQTPPKMQMEFIVTQQHVDFDATKFMDHPLTWDRLDTRWERKSVYKDKAATEALINSYVNQRRVRSDLERVFRIELYSEVEQRHKALMRYDNGDYLASHLDAAVVPEQFIKHPFTLGVYTWRKAVTCLLYLSQTDSAWLEGSLTLGHPLGPRHVISSKRGLFVAFTNTDDAWHGVSFVAGSTPRYVLTWSYFTNEPISTRLHPRAYFYEDDQSAWAKAARDARAGLPR